MDISAEQVKALRDKTNGGYMACKKALFEAGGDVEKAIEVLRKKGLSVSGKKEDRATNSGSVTSYIHGEGRVGVLLEVNCETDFVARTEQFKAFTKDLAMHIAAANPQYVRSEEVPEHVILKEKEIIVAQMQASGKPVTILEKIADGKIKKFYEDTCLLNQIFVKDSTKTVEQVVKEAIAALDENIVVRRFSRFVLGEASPDTRTCKGVE